MFENTLARLLLWGGYRVRSLKTNQQQFHSASNAIEDLIATASDVTLRGRRPIPPLPGITPVMRSWSAYMTIDHINGVHESMLERIPELEAGRQPDIGDISRFDHPDECGPEVMSRFRDLATLIADLPKAYAFTGRGSFVHPIFGRLNSRGAFALLAFHLQLHVPQIRRSVLINAQTSE